MSFTFLDINVRIGCHIVYRTPVATPILLVLRPRLDSRQMVRQETLSFTPNFPSYEFEDTHGNIVYRAMLQPGENIIHHDAIVAVSSLPDNQDYPGLPVPVQLLPEQVLRYTLPSRYCDSDRLLDFAWQNFSQYQHGLDRIYAICNWVHHNIEYRFGAGSPNTTASEIIHQRFGVCRDFAHVAIALCRAFNIPARYVTGHLPDIGRVDPGTPMDFHAYFEAYLGQGWSTFDARFNAPRIGRVKIAQGLDAIDSAFATVYGEAALEWFEVWAYQVDTRVVSVNDPIDLTKRLDGTPFVRVG